MKSNGNKKKIEEVQVDKEEYVEGEIHFHV